MAGWPPTDRKAVYVPPKPPRPVLSAVEQRAELAAARVRRGLPVSEGVLDEILRSRTPGTQPTIFTAREQDEIQGDAQRATVAAEVLADAAGVLAGRQACWIDGRRGVRVLLTEKHEHYRQRLADRLGADRVIVDHAPATEQTLQELQARVHERADDLHRDGVFLSSYGTRIDGFTIEYTAWDPQNAERVLRGLFGEIPILVWTGASNHTFTPFPFGSWHAEGSRLHVFYGLPRNGEQPGLCQAFEDELVVVVSLTVKDWLGGKRLVGGYTPSHATIELERPLAGRVVIDASANRARPHWSQS